VEGTFKGHLIQLPLKWARTSSTRPGCWDPLPPWCWIFPGMGHLHRTVRNDWFLSPCGGI